MDQVRADAGARRIFDEFWRSTPITKFLTLHRERLFPHLSTLTGEPIPRIIDFQLPYFPYAHPISMPERLVPVHPSSPETSIEPLEVPGLEPLDFLKEQDLKRWFVHGVLLTIRENPSLLKCVTSTEYDWSMMLRETHDLADIDLTFLWKTDFFKRMEESDVLRPEDMDSDAEELLKRIVFKVTEGFRRDPFFILRFFGSAVNRAGRLQTFFRDGLISYLHRMGVDYETYHASLKSLSEAGLLANYGTLFVCPECAIRNEPSVLVTFSKLSPEGARMNCPKCGKETEVAILYSAERLLYDLITFPDGFLSAAIAWYLTERGIPWKHSVPTKNGECDFLLDLKTGRVVLEVKVWDLRSGLLSRKISEAIAQVRNIATRLAAKEAWLVHNSLEVEFPGIVRPDGDPAPLGDVKVVSFLRLPELLSARSSA